MNTLNMLWKKNIAPILITPIDRALAALYLLRRNYWRAVARLPRPIYYNP